MKLRCKDSYLSLDRPLIMGVLNVTPDSFSDGGLWLDAERAVDHGLEMVEQGAAIVDVGGESTRPGAEPVAEKEELDRVLPVIEVLSHQTSAPISIDTRKPKVAELSVEAGATMINDTIGEGSDRAMDQLAARTGVAIVVMHSRGTPATMRELTDYEDVVTDVRDFLGLRAEQLAGQGVARDAICLDPGYGFAKNPQQSLMLLRRLDEIVELGYPVLVGTSRKSFIGATLDLPDDQRVEGTAATVAWAISKGAHIVRVHDVEPIVRTMRMLEAIKDS
ncbi:MAG TPA: dihydropteroate synthase [Actinomycetota bacterium]|nr:dihydropteroate synthase [Actinomycetota bacterium]